ncbi:MAG: DNA repair protein RadA [Bacteroidia bacterium]|nr:DNA repair protein RadA [Bacteroidia bacterium]
MAKNKTTFICQNCGQSHEKWQGKCRSCGQWNTIQEEVVLLSASGKVSPVLRSEKKPQKLSDIKTIEEQRIVTPDNEFNRVLGGGIVPGSVILLGGEPGIGKSTLLIQIALQLSPHLILYVSGEESERQIKMRTDRIPYINPNLYILSENILEPIINYIQEYSPDLVIIDSIQTLYNQQLDSAAGSVTQIRECTMQLLKIAKEKDIPICMIGHVTKDGSLAGPKVLEHTVDTVLNFEGDRHYSYRIVRTTKNRFGSTSELGIYEMQQDGLREVSNPSEIFLAQTDQHVSGVAVAATLEGNRSLLVDCQALVSETAYGSPQRAPIGFDLRRLQMLIAVLEKKCNLRLGNQDVFVNIAGGIRLDDPGLDLAIATSIISAYLNITLPEKIAFAGEIGLTGEIRIISRVEQRISEAQKLGFKAIVLSDNNKLSKNHYENIEIITVEHIRDIVATFFR